MERKAEARSLSIALLISFIIHAVVISLLPTLSSPQPRELSQRDISFLIEQLASLSSPDTPAEPAASDTTISQLPITPPLQNDISQDNSTQTTMLQETQPITPEKQVAPDDNNETPSTIQESPPPPEESPDIKDLDRRLKAIAARISYFDIVRQRIKSHLVVPLEVQTGQIRGTVLVQVTISRSGSIKEISLLQPSEHEILNQAATQTIQRAAPFPSLEGIVDLAELKINVPIHFNEEHEVP